MRSKVMNRHQERNLAFSLLFEHEFQKETAVSELYDRAIETREEGESPYVRKILSGVEAEEAFLEGLITEFSEGWTLARISKVNLAILKLSAYEMFFCHDIPLRVSMDEAIELCKKYSEEKARSFVNGILNRLAHKAAEGRDDGI